MRMKHAMETKDRHYLSKNLILLIVLAVSTFAVALSWFINSQQANVDGMNVSFLASEHLKISLTENGEYTYDVNLANDSDLLDELNFINVTSDGKTFFTPQTSVDNKGEVSPLIRETWSESQPNKDYLSLDLYLRSDIPLDVYLAKESDITPKVGKENLTWDYSVRDTSMYNPSSYGRFSRDAIVGAARVSFTNAPSAGTETHFVWIPHSDIFLNTKNEEWVLEGANDESRKHRYYKKNADDSYNLEENLQGNNPNVVTGLTATEYEIGSTKNTTKIATLNGTPDADGYYYQMVSINVWIEGTDAEARRALLSGEFDINLKFVSFEVD